MTKPSLRFPLGVQVGLVATLFAASLASLAFTAVRVVEREGRRGSAEDRLRRAVAALAEKGRYDLASVRPWPATTDAEWSRLNARLAADSDTVLRRFDGVEGGYFAREGRRFLGAAFPSEPEAVKSRRGGPRGTGGPPPLEFDLIETQVDASIRKGHEGFVVLALPPSTVAIRTAPVAVGGRAVGAAWAMMRLVDPVYLDHSLKGYGVAAGLAVGGIALALLLTVNLLRSLKGAAADRRRLQAELRRSERLAALGKLLAGVAHEVRNPLAGIRAIAQLWERGLEVNDEAFGHLRDEVDRLEDIVSRLLQFSRADAREMAPGDLNEVASEAARLAEDRAEGQGVRVELATAPDLPPVEMSSPALLQVLRNLTTNALQVMPTGGALRIETWGWNDSASVRVSDTGPGLPPEVHGHLFEPFFTTKAEGTGLGLAIAREIALAHRGDLTATNRHDGRGAVFTLTLPVWKEAALAGESRQ